MHTHLTQLHAELENVCRNEASTEAELAAGALRAFIATPGIWPLEDRFAQLLLMAAGVRLDSVHDLRASLLLLACLSETESTPLVCGHVASPGILCARKALIASDPNQISQVLAGVQHDLGPLLAIRALRSSSSGST